MNRPEVPYVDLQAQCRPLRQELIEAAGRVLDHCGFILGPEVEQFEQRFADMCRTRYAVGVSNGTDALCLVMKAFGIGPGDEVITVPNSFLASVSSIELIGARAVLVDVREDYNMDPGLIERAITPRTKAIIPVHLTGRPADLAPIMEIAQKHSLYVIEDCAQAVGAKYRDQPVGSFGIAGCFSLHPLKNLSAAGDGGVITTSDEQLYRGLCKGRNHGLKNRDECEFWSRNCRLDTIHAAMLLVKMDHIKRWNDARRDNAAYYQKRISDLVQVPRDCGDEHAVYHTFVIQCDYRDRLRRYLLSCGIDTKVHYPVLIHLQPAARRLGYSLGSFPAAERQAQRVLSLPVGHELSAPHRQMVAECIRRFYEQELYETPAQRVA